MVAPTIDANDCMPAMRIHVSGMTGVKVRLWLAALLLKLVVKILPTARIETYTEPKLDWGTVRIEGKYEDWFEPDGSVVSRVHSVKDLAPIVFEAEFNCGSAEIEGGPVDGSIQCEASITMIGDVAEPGKDL